MTNWTPARRLLARRVIIAAITVLVLVQAFYHLATGGLPSFITEVIVGAVLAFCLRSSFGDTTRRQRWRLLAERILLSTVAVTLMIAGLYHGTHQGYYSGVLQPLAAGLLGFAVYLSFDSPSRQSP